MNKLNLSLSIIHDQMNVNFILTQREEREKENSNARNDFFYTSSGKNSSIHTHFFVLCLSFMLLVWIKLSLWIFQEISNLPFFLIYEFILDFFVLLFPFFHIIPQHFCCSVHFLSYIFLSLVCSMAHKYVYVFKMREEKRHEKWKNIMQICNTITIYSTMIYASQSI